jgi:sulfate transport system substrate-binding protein
VSRGRARGAARLAVVWTALAVLTAVALAAGACGGAVDVPVGASPRASAGGSDVQLRLVAFSTPQVVYDEVVPRFAATPAGRGVGVSPSFGASADQSRAVAAGLPADVVSFALEPDMERLVDTGLVEPGWAGTPTRGLVSRSVVVFVVRRGNPLGIRSWRDLVAPGVDVLTPNPSTSGGAKWNLLAAFGAASDAGRDPDAGEAYLRALLERVAVQDKSAREAMQTFASGTGDVLLSYENEAITAQRKGVAVDYVVPDTTVSIEMPVAAVRTSDRLREAQAFVDYLTSPPAQERFAAWGYRPVHPAVAAEHADRFPRPARLFTVRDLGGWEAVDDTLFAPDRGVVAKLQAEVGGGR